MNRRFHPDKNASQIVFDITGGEKHLQTMNLSTIPNKKPLVKSPKDNFINRNDDIEGARYVPPKITPHDFNLDTSDIEGTRTRPMVNESKPPVDLMRLDDIEGSRPRIIRALPHSHRVVNPVDPQYDWLADNSKYDWSKWSSAVNENPGFIRDHMKNDDVEGAAPKSYKTDKPPKDIMKVDDISGSRPAKRMREMRNGIDTMNVKDINNDGIFKTTRVTDPLNPTYVYDGRKITDDFGKAKPPPPGREGPDPNFNLSDIEGSSADCSTKRYMKFKQPPPPSEEDDLKPADILMLPTMSKQTKELEMKEQMRTMRGEKIRYYENRNLHVDYGTGDPIQAMLRKQRETRGYRHRTPTF
ncbi:hypothetical protein TRFO_15932 [Tritrichomonas foetus]|uniref:Uncharacterized protein n=1 Tax=Tritrichomonas foetus TaxID=1144522 RepID=A0A1J4KRC7_9EUKA|nr:hypothetical protein TRFO_15932 [Tritrichomonas foetus]|eukprot:OHT13815.1 hypothetical protein TRFO_15932 [Tritrichomonas foetus]